MSGCRPIVPLEVAPETALSGRSATPAGRPPLGVRDTFAARRVSTRYREMSWLAAMPRNVRLSARALIGMCVP